MIRYFNLIHQMVNLSPFQSFGLVQPLRRRHRIYVQQLEKVTADIAVLHKCRIENTQYYISVSKSISPIPYSLVVVEIIPEMGLISRYCLALVTIKMRCGEISVFTALLMMGDNLPVLPTQITDDRNLIKISAQFIAKFANFDRIK